MESTLRHRVILREKRSMENTIPTSGGDLGLHQTVKKAGEPAWPLKPRASTQEQFHKSSLASEELKALASAARNGPHKTSMPEDELYEMAKLASQRQSERQASPGTAAKAHAQASPKLQPAPLMANYDDYSSVEDELRELETLWQQQQKEQQKLELMQRLRNSQHNKQPHSFMTKEEKHRVRKRMKNDLTAHGGGAFYSATDKPTQDKRSIKSGPIKQHHLKAVLDMAKSKPHRAKKATEKSQLLNKVVRMRRSLVHLSSENSMAESLRRADGHRRKRRDDTEALQEKLEQDDLSPEQLIILRNLLDTVGDSYYDTKGPDSDSAPAEEKSAAIDEDENNESKNLAMEKQAAAAVEQIMEQQRDGNAEEQPSIRTMSDLMKEEEPTAAASQNVDEVSEEPSLYMSLVKLNDKRGLFIPLDQEGARRQAAAQNLHAAVEDEEERARLFVLASLLARKQPANADFDEAAADESGMKEMPKRNTLVKYPDVVDYSLAEQEESPSNFQALQEDNSDTSPNLQRDFQNYLLSSDINN